MNNKQIPQFPTMLRKMWTGQEVQAWIDANLIPNLPADKAGYSPGPVSDGGMDPRNTPAMGSRNANSPTAADATLVAIQRYGYLRAMATRGKASENDIKQAWDMLLLTLAKPESADNSHMPSSDTAASSLPASWAQIDLNSVLMNLRRYTTCDTDLIGDMLAFAKAAASPPTDRQSQLDAHEVNPEKP